jgi:hypothetical protein
VTEPEHISGGNGAPENDGALINSAINKEAEEKLAELVAEAYVLRTYYTNRLERMRVSALAEYSALSKEERTQSKKMDIGMKYAGLAGELEGDCDGKMNSLVARIEKELKLSGSDTSVINEIKFYYAEEKSLKKAYFLSLYN